METAFKPMASENFEGVGSLSSTAGEVDPGLGLATLVSPGSAVEFQACLGGGGGGGGQFQCFALFQRRLCFV